MADLALIVCALIWGGTFVVVKDALATVAPVRFLTLRFLLGGAILLTLAAVEAWRRRNSAGRRTGRTAGSGANDLFDRQTWKDGALVGLALFAGFVTQTIGLVWTTPAVSGFLTGLSVVLVPILGLLFLGVRVSGPTWVGVVAAFLGLSALTLRDRFTPGPGEAITLLTAVAFAFHILLLDRFAPRATAFALAAVQVVAAAVLGLVFLPFDAWLSARSAASAPAAALFDPLSARAWTQVVAMGVVASAGAFLLQTYAQRHVPAARVGVLLTLEPVFAALFSWWFYGERFGVRATIGMALILAGMLIVETLGRRAQTPPTP